MERYPQLNCVKLSPSGELAPSEGLPPSGSTSVNSQRLPRKASRGSTMSNCPAACVYDEYACSACRSQMPSAHYIYSSKCRELSSPPSVQLAYTTHLPAGYTPSNAFLSLDITYATSYKLIDPPSNRSS